MASASVDHDGSHPDCQRCYVAKLRSIQVTPTASPAQRRHGVPRDISNSNAWERGPVTDHRGVQTLKADGTPLTRKELANNRRYYDDQRRQLAHQSAQNVTRY